MNLGLTRVPSLWLPVVITMTFSTTISGSRAAEFQFRETLVPARPFQVMAHRGQSGQAPENTRAALEHCIEDGLEWAEVDLRLTRDGYHVLAHDATVIDAAGRSWKVAEHSLAELQALDLGSRFAARFASERLLTLADCFKLCKGRLNLYLDCKAVNAGQLSREILSVAMQDQVIVYSGLDTLRQVQQLGAGRIATMTKWRPALGGVEWAVSNGLAAVEIDAPDVTPEVRKAFDRAGLKVEVKVLGEWDRPVFWDRALDAGVDYFQTDLPEELVAHALWRRVPKRPVQVSLHRGANRYAPENTMPAFAKAVRLGVDFVEFDVRATRDGDYFLLHDGRLDRTTDGHGPIDQNTTAEVRRLSAGVKFQQELAGVRLPGLEEFLDGFSGKVGLYFDAKAITPAALAAALERHHAVASTVVYQSPHYLAELKAINPQIRGLAPLGKPEEIDGLARMLKPYAVDADWDILSKDVIARCHAAGMRVFSDSLGQHETVEDYLKAMDWGIDLIQTDHPLRLFRAIELWAARHTPESAELRSTVKE